MTYVGCQHFLTIMIISQKHRLIFSHNPKVAGSAVRQVMAHLHDHHIEFWHQAWYAEFGRVMDMAHVPIHDLRQVLNLNEFAVLVLVRDPYTRFMSSVAEHCRQHDINLHGDPEILNKWIHSIMDEANFRFNWKYIHFCPQHYFALPATELKVIKFDLPRGGWLEVQKWMAGRFGIEIGDLPVVRSSVGYQNKFEVEHLDAKSIVLINKIYHRDFEFFGYHKRKTPSAVNLQASHYDRINSIHNPNLELMPTSWFNEGEKKAYYKKWNVVCDQSQDSVPSTSSSEPQTAP